MGKTVRLSFMKRSAPKLIIFILCIAILLCSCDTGAVQASSDNSSSPPARSAVLTASLEAASTPSPVITDIPTPVPTPSPTPVPTPVPPADMGGSPYYIYVEKGSHTVTVYGKDENFQYTVVVQQYIAAMGLTVGKTPTGKFKISGKRDRWHEFHGKDDTKVYAQYATPFYGRLYIHGPLYSSKRNTSMFGYGELGKNATQGCLRMSAGAAYWIFTNCPDGTIVDIVNGSPKKTQADMPPKPGGKYPRWDPTDPADPGEEPESIAIATPAPMPGGTMPIATPVPSPMTKALSGMWLGTCKAGGGVNAYAKPAEDAVIGESLPAGASVVIIEQGEYWHKVLIGLKQLYIKTTDVDMGSELSAGVALPRTELLYAGIAPTSSKGKKDELVDMRLVDPSVVISMAFASDTNVLGRPVYTRDICLLQKGVAQNLKKAQQLFRKDGYSLKIVDAYRPQKVQSQLFIAIADASYTASPDNKGLAHSRGAAVDITLIDKNGVEIEMPSPIHTFGKTSVTTYKGMTKAARKNMEYMQKIMKKCGFEVYKSEWWHFTDKNADKYLVTNLNLADIPMAQVKGAAK